MTRSSSLRWSSKEKLYWKPEQPPPSTATRIMTGLASLAARKAMRRAALSLTENVVSLMGTRCGLGAVSSMLGVACQAGFQAVDVTQDPQIGNFPDLQGQQCGARPFHRLAGRDEPQKRSAVNALKTHAGKCPLALANQIKDGAAIVAKCPSPGPARCRQASPTGSAKSSR